jgi:hypothetical protein
VSGELLRRLASSTSRAADEKHAPLAPGVSLDLFGIQLREGMEKGALNVRLLKLSGGSDIQEEGLRLLFARGARGCGCD